MWAAILEKAWAKVKGNYINADGGLIENGITSLTGAPVFRYQTSAITSTAEATAMFNQIKAADAANYIMGSGTAGGGNDQVQNSCGIAESHAYSIIAAFTLTEANGNTVDALLMRNPWGACYYN